MARQGTSDARRISFTLPTVVSIVVGVAGIVIAQYMALANIRSDLRDIMTKMEVNKDVIAAKEETRDVKYSADMKRIEDRFAEFDKQIAKNAAQAKLDDYDLKAAIERSIQAIGRRP